MSTPTSKQGIIIGSTLAGLQVLAGGAAIGDVVGAKAAGLFVLLVGAAQAAWTTFNQTVQVVPASAVVAVADAETGTVLAGPAADQANGTVVTVDTAPAGRHAEPDTPPA